MNETPTSYSLLIMHNADIYAVRDPYGNRPLCIGRLIPVSNEARGTLGIYYAMHASFLLKKVWGFFPANDLQLCFYTALAKSG